MSAGRESPRNAIRNWLAHTEQTGDAGETIPTRDDGRDGQRSRSRHRNKRRRCRSRHEANDVSLRGPDGNTLLQVKTNEKPTRVEAQDDSGLAKRLGLHPPFQAMDLKQLDSEKRLDLTGTMRYRKRKRSSSATSYLEPAVADDPIEAGNDVRDGDATRSLPNAGPGEEIEISSSSSALSSSSPSPVKPAKTYERRARRKTKEDRYELKQDKKAKKERVKGKKTKNKEASRKRQKSSKKSGATLLHNFTAKNVASERLTMRPRAKLGLFTKGRASSPLRRRGLPDLSFSEMTFLNTRGKPDEALKGTSEKKASRKSKAENLDDEISRFFASTRAPLTERDHNITSHNDRQVPLQQAKSRRTRDVRYSSIERSSVPAVELPGRPFLGFGQRGPHPPSHTDRREDVGVGAVRTRGQSRSERSHPTTYYTWSQSSELGPRHPKRQIERDLATEGFKGSPNRGRGGRSLRKAGPSQPKDHHAGYCEKCSTRTADDGLHYSQVEQEEDPTGSNGRGKPNISANDVDYQRDRGSTSERVSAINGNLVHSQKPLDIVPTTKVSDTQLLVDPQVTLQTNKPDESIVVNEPFTKVLDALFKKVQAEIPLLHTTNRPPQGVIEEDFSVHQPVFQAASPLKNRHQGTPTIHSFGHAQQAVKGQTEPAQIVVEQRHSPAYTKGTAVNYPQHTLTGNSTAYPPKIFAPLPSPAPISGYGRPATIYGQQFQFEDSGVDLPRLPNRDDVHSSRSWVSRPLTARPYGTPVSLESRPSRGTERIQSNNREPSHRRDWHYSDHLYGKDINEDMFEGQAAGSGYCLSQTEPIGMDVQSDIHHDSHAPIFHPEDIDIPKQLNFDSHKYRPATTYSHSPSFVNDLALPYQEQRNLGLLHQPTRARSSRGNQSPFITNPFPCEPIRGVDCRVQPITRGSSRGEQGVGVRQDEDLGPVGFWKPNRLY